MALAPFARWRGPVPNMTPKAMTHPVMGLVLHIEQGSEPGTDAWFHNGAAQASSHFGNPKSGPLDQWVDTDDKAWAEAGGNANWISVENEGKSGEVLNDNQINNAAQLLAWIHDTDKVPLVITDNRLVRGLGWHGMGGLLWGGHLDCPGTPIVNQRAAIIARAQQIITPPTPKEATVALNAPVVAIRYTPNGNGYWIFCADGGVFNYGDAKFFGSLGNTHLNGAIVDADITLDGNGYVMVGADGGVFAFGDAKFSGTPAG